VVVDRHPQVEDGLDLRVKRLGRQAVVGDAPAQHAPRRGVHLEDRDLVSLAAQEIGGAQPGRSGPDHGHALSRIGPAGWGVGGELAGVPMGHETLDPVDVHGSVQGIAAALGLAGVGADAPAHRRQGVAFLDDLEGLMDVAAGHVLEVFLDIDMGRAAQAAGGLTVTVVVAQQGLQVDGAVAFQRLGLGADQHALFHQARGGRNETRFLALFDLDEAHLAGAGGADPRVVSQGRDGDAVGLGCIDDGHAIFCGALLVVDGKCKHSHPL